MITQETAREMLKLLKLAGNGGCQACIGHPLVKQHSEFCCKVTAVVAKAEEEK